MTAATNNFQRSLLLLSTMTLLLGASLQSEEYTDYQQDREKLKIHGEIPGLQRELMEKTMENFELGSA